MIQARVFVCSASVSFPALGLCVVDVVVVVVVVVVFVLVLVFVFVILFYCEG